MIVYCYINILSMYMYNVQFISGIWNLIIWTAIHVHVYNYDDQLHIHLCVLRLLTIGEFVHLQCTYTCIYWNIFVWVHVHVCCVPFCLNHTIQLYFICKINVICNLYINHLLPLSKWPIFTRLYLGCKCKFVCVISRLHNV